VLASTGPDKEDVREAPQATTINRKILSIEKLL
jgi:hypothetical protein